jgi:predicted PurR-regulated permease PerM
MINALIQVLIVAIVIGIVVWLAFWLLDMLPMDDRFKQFAKALVILIAVLILLFKLLPLIGVSLGADLSKSLMSQSSTRLMIHE